jgi:alkylation response protein AidB-like acyl-CoA dehydrogenase
MSVAGKDATNEFYALHRRDVLDKFGPRLIIGSVANEFPKLPSAAKSRLETSRIPYAEIMDAREGYAPSPFYTKKHHELRRYVREFVETHVRAEALENEDANEGPSKELWKKAADAGIFLLKLGPGKHQKLAYDMGFRLPCGIMPEEMDFFMEKVITEELSRHCCPGELS